MEEKTAEKTAHEIFAELLMIFNQTGMSDDEIKHVSDLVVDYAKAFYYTVVEAK